ncbi:hypothetical protein DCC39_14600 [Pueribacillus theae]|uniref:Uncharacterized protein n=1 Tax=Pueribacillus theae TaxID=2171751 RepID=A0A2U1JUK5_9BACI|nr:hypothetical protein [Pueribacillus theae]PWA08665.1 hypothetical protein DCC39_14600 [Pueribacillus theae]
MAITAGTIKDVLNHVFRNTPMTSPSKVYVGLFTSSGEVNGNAYERQELTFTEPSGGIIKNAAEVRFAIATADWGEVVGAGIFDAETGGKRLDDANIAAARIVRENDQFVIPVGNYTIELR